ncbi:MAG: hypothetical protein DRQ41_15345, partial [Gammaproteobacteria bacterium]
MKHEQLTYNLAPGNILQNMYLERRLKKLRKTTFIELGSGNGNISAMLLNFDYRGAKVDVIISSHVIEHFPDELLEQYFSKCELLLNRGGDN